MRAPVSQLHAARPDRLPVERHPCPTSAFDRRGKRRFSDNEPTFAKRQRHHHVPARSGRLRLRGRPARRRPLVHLGSAQRQRARAPRPYPDWLVTQLAAVDTELGILKTGKEADVFVLRRGVPGTGRSCLLAAKRYRDAEHKMFHRDSAYLEGRRARESRDTRAMAQRTAAGRQMIARQWANAEFAALRPAAPLRGAGAVPGAGARHRAAAGVHRGARRHRRAAAGRDPARGAPSWRAWGTSWWRRWSCSPAAGWPTATCPRTTCWSGGAG